MDILVLTDHQRHTESNSVYGLVRALYAHKQINQVKVASRSDKRNGEFFHGAPNQGLWAVSADAHFSFPANTLFDSKAKLCQLDQFDSIFLRLPRPIASDFFKYLKENYDERRIVNRPSGIEKTSNKSFLLEFEKFVEPMALCTGWDEIVNFIGLYDCVLKPLEDYGGRGLVRILNGEVSQDGETISLSTFYEQYQRSVKPYLAMKYLKNVSAGDKRIVVAGGRILTSSLRLPSEGNWLCNVAQGGTDEVSEPDDREREIVNYIQPLLEKEGIFYYGLDTLENDDGDRVISEINTLSIGGISPAESKSGLPLSHQFATLYYDFINKQ